jgi:hypothetical protein
MEDQVYDVVYDCYVDRNKVPKYLSLSLLETMPKELLVRHAYQLQSCVENLLQEKRTNIATPLEKKDLQIVRKTGSKNWKTASPRSHWPEKSHGGGTLRNQNIPKGPQLVPDWTSRMKQPNRPKCKNPISRKSQRSRHLEGARPYTPSQYTPPTSKSLQFEPILDSSENSLRYKHANNTVRNLRERGEDDQIDLNRNLTNRGREEGSVSKGKGHDIQTIEVRQAIIRRWKTAFEKIKVASRVINSLKDFAVKESIKRAPAKRKLHFFGVLLKQIKFIQNTRAKISLAHAADSQKTKPSDDKKNGEVNLKESVTETGEALSACDEVARSDEENINSGLLHMDMQDRMCIHRAHCDMKGVFSFWKNFIFDFKQNITTIERLKHKRPKKQLETCKRVVEKVEENFLTTLSTYLDMFELKIEILKEQNHLVELALSKVMANDENAKNIPGSSEVAIINACEMENLLLDDSDVKDIEEAKQATQLDQTIRDVFFLLYRWAHIWSNFVREGNVKQIELWSENGLEESNDRIFLIVSLFQHMFHIEHFKYNSTDEHLELKNINQINVVTMTKNIGYLNDFLETQNASFRFVDTSSVTGLFHLDVGQTLCCEEFVKIFGEIICHH